MVQRIGESQLLGKTDSTPICQNQHMYLSIEISVAFCGLDFCQFSPPLPTTKRGKSSVLTYLLNEAHNSVFRCTSFLIRHISYSQFPAECISELVEGITEFYLNKSQQLGFVPGMITEITMCSFSCMEQIYTSVHSKGFLCHCQRRISARASLKATQLKYNCYYMLYSSSTAIKHKVYIFTYA